MNDEEPFATLIPELACDDMAEDAGGIEAVGVDVYEPLREVWYTLDDAHAGFCQLLLQDRDIYVLRGTQPAGRPPTTGDKADRDYR